MKGNVFLLASMLFVFGAAQANDGVEVKPTRIQSAAGWVKSKFAKAKNNVLSAVKKQKVTEIEMQPIVEIVDEVTEVKPSRIRAAAGWVASKVAGAKNGVVSAVKNHRVATAIIIGLPIAAYVAYKVWNNCKDKEEKQN